jgi:hypothetical protein
LCESDLTEPENGETKSEWLKRDCFHNFACDWRLHFSDFGHSATR